ncbi:PadR family transcriptional regulator [Mycolicibacterium aubagnense]|uniref:PadR family transcriptional regulator n=1 Tax=Mycolicibacterium aubagnense TaxID=319707 RepID=A0ABN5YMS5_9MYCO|nr:PadR family transcriptional regulator [Mycolicibacterium aubagnense]TLH61071.1 PadR family transcriptional regulator [Mycolicibacterium aubagnense]WGI35060.1 PadR family transcriptional regulator [Mycolicibacterium aubagnense]BBX83009.1 PadR family transcriptional regulator [Mycolicibacterium aubagnense]
MSLQFAILTALTERASTGIELTRRFDRAFGYFWAATHQQIYRELDKLKNSGLAEASTPDRPERGQPKRFSITPAGRQALSEWLCGIDDPAPERMSIAVRVRAAAALGETGAVRAVIAHHLASHQATLANYREIDARDFAAPVADADVLRHLVLKAGLRTEQAWVDWCREALDVLDRLASSHDGGH